MPETNRIWKGPAGLVGGLVPLAEIHVDPKNARAHDDRNLAAIKGSYEQFGQQKPIVVDKAGKILAGNGQYEGAKALGWTHLAVVRTDLKAPRPRAMPWPTTARASWRRGTTRPWRRS